MARKKTELTVKDLRNWKLLERFQMELERVAPNYPLHPSFSDPRRRLGHASYLSLFLLGLMNPAVTGMRSLVAVSSLDKVKKQTGSPKVSLGSFSEIQELVDPELLKQVFNNLVEQLPSDGKLDPKLAHLNLMAQDGSLWSALPRMSWAQYGVGSKGEAKGVRLHLRFNILKNSPDDAIITPGNGYEPRVLREMVLPGQTIVGDRGYGRDYQLFRHIEETGAFFVFRINDTAVIESVEELPLSAEEQKAGILRHAWVHLGATEKLRTIRLRLVEVKRDGQHLLLVTNHAVKDLSAELVSAVYRRRWSIELYFRWIKCMFGCRHFFAESQGGAALQLYLALIGGVLLELYTGERPNKRALEFLRFYIMGWATAEETVRLIEEYSAKAKKAKKS